SQLINVSFGVVDHRHVHGAVGGREPKSFKQAAAPGQVPAAPAPPASTTEVAKPAPEQAEPPHQQTESLVRT
ncbi:hypothetical protein ACWDAZ_27810, partial [Streptomyces sp. NPDC001215]